MSEEAKEEQVVRNINGEIATKIFNNTLYGAILGSASGFVLAYWRSHNKLTYSRYMGLNFALFSALYTGCYEVISKVRGKGDNLSAVTAGALTGASTGTIYGGRRLGFSGAFMLGSASFVGFYAVEAFSKWKKAKGERRFTQKYGVDIRGVPIRHTQKEFKTLSESLQLYKVSDDVIEKKIQKRVEELLSTS